LLDARNISRNLPSKLFLRFNELREEFHAGKEIDYSTNIFLERSQLRKHRKLPEEKAYADFVKQFPR